MSNPFADETTATVVATEPEDVATEVEDLDVDAGADNGAEDTVEETKSEDKPAKEQKEKKPARPAVPEGFISPVAAAKELTKHLIAKGKLKEGEEVKPQVVYSYIRNNQEGKSKNPIMTYSEGGRENLLKLPEFLAWWDAKDERVATSKANKAEKDAKKAEKATKAAEAPAEAEAETTEAPAEAE